LLLFGWAIASIGFILGVRRWYQEREGRGGPIPVDQAGMLLAPLRFRFIPPRPIVERFGLAAGQTVLEVGPGPGYFTPEVATVVGAGGRIVCVDLQPGMLALLRGRLREQRTLNAHLVAGDATRLPLVSRSVDAAFLVTVLGEIPDRPAALNELRRVLKPGARLSFVEMLGDPDYVAVDTLKDLCGAFGFELIDHQPRWYGYLMTFAAPAPGAGYV
jgi:ubiquinone/menaquinone biosynthesis C-methylase UbiE